MRNEIFQSHYPQDSRLSKNLRLNAREYAHEFTYTPYMENPDESHAITNQKYGRSSGSNN
jgi:hypothetical protein